jgi:GTP-binding protein
VRSLRFKGPWFLISGATGTGTKDLTEAVMRFLEERAAAEAAAGGTPAGATDDAD